MNTNSSYNPISCGNFTNSDFLLYDMEATKNTSQINLKLPAKLVLMAEEYAEYYGYSNVQ